MLWLVIKTIVIGLIGNLTKKIVQGPVDVCIGTALGIVWGFILIIVPPSPWAKIYDNSKENIKIQVNEKFLCSSYNVRNV